MIKVDVFEYMHWVDNLLSERDVYGESAAESAASAALHMIKLLRALEVIRVK